MYICRVDIRWLKKKEHRDLKKVESDKKLTDDKKKILRAIHKRNNSYVLTPSAKDLEFLQEHYGEFFGTQPHVSLITIMLVCNRVMS